MAAWVKGGAADADGAVQAAAAILAAARTPVFAGLNADVAAIRAATHLAGRIGASLDSLGSAGTYADLGALARVGAMTTTPAEAVGRADVVLLVGEAPRGAALVERLNATAPSRGRAAGGPRTLLRLDAPFPLPVAVAALRAHARGHLADDHGLLALAKALAGAQYGAVLYDPAELGAAGVEMLQGLVMDLNERTRCFALALSGADQDRAALQVAAWTTGQAIRVGFGRHVPEHDPWRFDAARLAASGEADAALWLSSRPAEAPAWLAGLPSIALVSGEPDPGMAEVVIAVGEPGAEVGGVLWNEGRAGLSYRAPAAPAARPAAAEILGRIAATLDARKDA